ncbi:unnamed protein product [Schistosoma mattheei]|uniref:Zinc finger HIT domain-containing protein 3 n=1 Tax=Schistosoma mattheei TaxID=31246 RepID=A0A183Q3L1_9TREM|nr:unnamed protein product [Schistosoma mattheei]VDP84351.1 unnamed protein product [Schistosoma mattheei]
MPASLTQKLHNGEHKVPKRCPEENLAHPLSFYSRTILYLKCFYFRQTKILSVDIYKILAFNEMVLCAICSIETYKYKCPRCIAPYCSLACYQKHKQNECKPETCVPRVVHATVEREDEMVDYVPKKILEGLKYSDKIRDLLKNHHLRSLLRFLNDTNKPYSALENVMREPIFVEFSDECLKIVDSNL